MTERLRPGEYEHLRAEHATNPERGVALGGALFGRLLGELAWLQSRQIGAACVGEPVQVLPTGTDFIAPPPPRGAGLL